MARDERSDPSSADDGSGHDRNLLGLSGINVRTTCGAYPVLYSPDEVVPIGGAKVTRSSNSDQVTLIGAGVTVQNCLAAADQLASGGIGAVRRSVLAVKRIETDTLLAAAAATRDRLVVVEDHYPAGGNGRCGARSVERRRSPGSHHPPGGPGPTWVQDPPGSSWRRPGSQPATSRSRPAHRRGLRSLSCLQPLL
jgi:transketolase